MPRITPPDQISEATHRRALRLVVEQAEREQAEKEHFAQTQEKWRQEQKAKAQEASARGRDRRVQAEIVEGEAAAKRRVWAREHRAELDEIAARKRRDSPARYNTLQKRCRKTGRELSLTFEEACVLYAQDCTYCGDPGPGGIDRVDSDEGYVSGNVVPCCRICNWMKSASRLDDWFGHMRKILAHQN